MSVVALIQSCGYRVFMRNPTDENCFYTDGEKIGYAQWGRCRPCVTSVHKPNRTTGTGFGIAEDITPESLKDALHCHAPSWASGTVKKYRNWEAFHKESNWNASLKEVPAVQP